MIDKLQIRHKLIVLLAVPLAALLVLAGVGAVQRRGDASQAEVDADRIELARQAASAAHELHVEGELGGAALAAGAEERRVAAWKAQWKDTDAAVDRFRSALEEGESQRSAELQADIDVALRDVGKLDITRRAQASLDASTWPALVYRYHQSANVVVSVVTGVSREIADPELASPMRGWASLVRYESSLGEVTSLLTGAFTEGRFSDPLTYRRMLEARQRASTERAVTEATSSSAVQSSLRNILAQPSVDRTEALQSAAVDSRGGSGRLAVDPAEWRKVSQVRTKALADLDTGITDDLLSLAGDRTASAERSARLYLICALFALIVAVLVGSLLARAIARPIDDLTKAAEGLSQDQLPRLVDSLRNPAEDDVSYLASSLTPIEVPGNDEISKLAEAFNRVQKVAVEVATEQAQLLRKGIGEMFVSLARRNQTLLDRQIEFIDQLESDEDDPDQLENLFKLDHLATRMRRNAESLLVLAGAEPARRRGRPVPLTDVVRAALGEVEDFARIDLMALDEVMVQNNAARDVAHLLSELMENATTYSPPESRVEVVGHRTKADGYVISIIDHGIGMSPHQITEANALLAQPPLVGLALSRSLGFIVIGRLAARFGVAIRLMPSPAGGVTAVVSLPANIVLDAPEAALDAPSTVGSTAWEPAPSSGPEPSYNALPPLDLGPAETVSEEPPARTLSEAVPHGKAFDDVLADLVSTERAGITAERPAPPAPEEPRPTADGAPPTSPGLFGGGAPATARSSPANLPEPLPGEAPEAEAPPTETRSDGPLPEPLPEPLLGSSGPPPAPPSAPAPPAPPSPFTAPPPAEPAPPAPDAEPVRLFGAGTAEAEATNGDAQPVLQRTAAGLAKRAPRRTSEGLPVRSVPGGEGRSRVGASATRRSPDEVRNMLSAYRGGMARAQYDDAGDGAEPNDEEKERG